MTAVFDSHTVLWVPRYWPAVGGTEFHSHELAQHLSRTQCVTVLAHCTKTENSQQPLTASAVQTRFTDTTKGNVRTIELAPNRRYLNILTWLGQYYERNRIIRMFYKLFFSHAYKQSTSPFLKEADRIHFIYNGLTEAAFLAANQAAALNIPFIFTPNILDTCDTGSDWDSASFHSLYEQADQLIALTEHEANWLVDRGINREKISVVPYGPILESRDPSMEHGAIGELLCTRYILFLGRLVPGKGANLLINAFKALSESDPSTHLVMVGPTTDHRSPIIDELIELSDNAKIHFIQDVSQPIKTALLEEATVLCVPSNSESLGGVYIEAMASKTPVIALDRPVSRCVIDHEKEGLLVTPDEQSLINGLRSLLDNPNLAEQMGLAGSLKVDKQFSWPVVSKNILDVYSKSDSECPIELRHAA